MTADSGAPAALDRLDAALGPGFITTLVMGTGRPPRLTVVSRDTGAGEDIYADDHGWYWWPWAQRIAPTSDPLAAAHRVTAALRGPAQDGGWR